MKRVEKDVNRVPVFVIEPIEEPPHLLVDLELVLSGLQIEVLEVRGLLDARSGLEVVEV